MQPYRTIKPHRTTGCKACSRMSPGHPVCQNCDQIATTQVQRHATQAEYDALPEAFKPIDGLAAQAVFMCDDCADLVEPFCQHPAPSPAPCPKCQATGTQPCVTKKGTARPGSHAARAQAQPPPPTPCRHWHREDCDVFGNCPCSQDDEAPAREPRIVQPAPPPGPAPIHLPVHGPMLDLLTANGVDVDRVVSNTLAPAGDGSNVMVLTTTMVIRQANGDLAFDDHGQARTEASEIRLVIPRPTDPVTDMPALPAASATGTPAV